MRERRWRPVSSSWKDPRNQVTTISYNSFGQPVFVQGPIATEPPTTFTYDANGNLITTTDPLGNSTQRVYDAVSRLTSLTDPRGLSTLFRYDGLNRVTEIADARQGITRFSYDANGNLLTVSDAKNQTTTYTYNNMDRLATRKDALNRQESYQYDLAGNLSQFTDRKNQQTTFIYDALNRRTTATYPDSTTTFIYDSVGRLTKASDTATGAGTIDFAYDTLDRLIQEVTGQGAVNYQYDVLGRRTQMVSNGQQPVTYGYDAASRLTQVAQGSLTVGLGYDNANRRTSLTYPNGTSTSYGYDIASRLTGITHLGPSGIIEALTYQYDAAGNRTSLTRNNDTASLLPAAVVAATYDAANEQTVFAGVALTYDNNGNLMSDGTNTYVWDARNRLVAISGGATASFIYDVLGRRVSKNANGTTTQFFYDRLDIAAEIGGGAVGSSYLRSPYIDDPFIRQVGTGNEHYHVDGMGGIVGLSNPSGAAATTYTYEPFGKTIKTGNSTSPFQYTGREDDGTGLYYYRARYYHPRLQRFIVEDPLGFSAGNINLYVYAGNSPTNFRDPLGLCNAPASGSGYCVNAYIPDKYVPYGPISLPGYGDNRGPDPNSGPGSYRAQQTFGGDNVSSKDAGTSRSTFGLDIRGDLGPCNVSPSNLPLGGRKIKFHCEAINGFHIPNSPLSYDFTVIEDSNGVGRVTSANGTSFPNYEVWQYGGPDGPRQIFDYRTSGTAADLQNGTGPLPIP